jgi:TRAP-type transport system small permease protein
MRKPAHLLISEVLVVSLLVVLVCTTFTQVIFRYVINYSLPWADELARVCLVWLVFSGMVLCFVREQHAVVGVLLERYRGRIRRIAHTGIDVLLVVLFVAVMYGGARLMVLTGGQTMSGLGISRGFIYAAVPLGASLMLIEIALRIYRRFTSDDEADP